MFHLLALAIDSPLADLLGFVPDSVVRNRTLLFGVFAVIVLAFVVRRCFRNLDARRFERRADQQEISATTGNGPPTFNG